MSPDEKKAGQGPAGEPGFAFLYVPDSDQELAGGVPEEKYAIAREVYEELLRARGDRRSQPPPFVMDRREGFVAWMNPRGPEIGLEEKAYDVCASFGDDMRNAIAALLGHELTHYYEKHDWRRHFVSQYSDLEVGKDLGALDDAKRNEAQADYLGGLLSYSAGYDVLGRMPELCEKLYAAYGLKEELRGYPTLAERKTIALRAQGRLQELTKALDMANYLVAIGQYGEAFDYYNYILKEYQSREIYNNAGVCALLAALEHFEAGAFRFRLPIELDLSGRRAGKGVEEDKTKTKQQLIDQAIDHFKSAIVLDEHYAPAYLNLGCAYTLQGDYRRAQYMAEVEAMDWAKAAQRDKVLTDCLVLSGIIEALEGDDAAAKKKLQRAADQGNALAAQNLGILEGKTPQSSSGISMPLQEQIDGVSLLSFAQEPEADEGSEQVVNADRTLYHKTWPDKNSRLLISMSDDGDRMVFIHTTNPGFEGQTGKGLSAGATLKEVTDAYGAPDRSIELTDGRLLVYPGLLLAMDRQDELKRWVTYLVDELE